MKMTRALLALSTLAFFANNAMADDQSPWLIRARVVNVEPANKSDPIGGAGASDRLEVSNKTIPELDISYFFTSNIAAELILTYPQKHDVTLDGNNIGNFKELPSTLTVQYHFNPTGTIRPYVGVGINYTNISSVNLLSGTGSLEHSSVGGALQAGVDFAVDRNWSINVDIKKVQIRSDVSISGTKVSTVQVDPLLIGVGLGYRF
jgi:outer membrane protein